jgi:glutamate synthase (NADPH/NADH) small chain
VIFRWLTDPVRVVGEGGHVTGLECRRMQLGAPGPDGRRKPEQVDGSTFVLPVDMVIKAVGQEGNFAWLSALKLKAQGGRFVVDPGTGATSHPKVFAAGDCAGEGGAEATVVAVVQAGKRAALGIHAALTGKAAPDDVARAGARILGAPDPTKGRLRFAEYTPQGVHA